MMAQPVPHHSDESQTTDKKRVKVYELRSNDWFDRGTGFCSASFIPVPEGQPREARVTVESEDQPNRLLLETKIIRDDGFQKQQETLIVWTENDVDMALSFQEPEGCAMIWKFVDGVQQTFHGGSGPDDGLSDDLALDMTSAIIQLPPPDLGVLPELESNMRIMSSTPNGRDALAKAIIKDDYIRKLIPLVEMAEDLESVHDLHRLCNIMKTIITLNDTNIMEHAVSDECILGVVGALEYDPDFPAHKANHRQWLSNEGRYKEVVKIQDDQIDRKIHQTYRLQYLKDVVLARCLDDPTFSVLNSLIFFNQVDIVQHLQSNASLLKELFAIFQNPAEDQRRKKEAVLFIQSCCAIAKNLQPPIRQTLYTNFLNHGLLPVINFGLRNIDVAARTGATDVLVSMIDHDPQMIRHTIYRQIQEGAAPLTDTLIDLLLVEVDLGIRSQISDALKVLLDPTPPPPPEAREFVAGQPQRARPMPAVDPQQELFLLHFYENSAPRLFKPLIELDRRVDMRANGPNDGIYSHLNDILCFNIRQHGHRSRAFVVNYNLAQRYNQLLSCKEKHLQLVAIKFFRQLVTVQDEFYIRHLTEKKVLGPVLDVLLRTLPRDNLLGSACLELFFLINKENVRELIKHLIDNYREKVQALAYLDTFRQMLNSYDNNQGYTVTIDPSFWELEDEMGQRPQSMGGRGMMEHLTVDSAQEDYWNTSDDEDDHPERGGPSHGPVTNGGPLKPLVEYTSDEETDENGDAVMDPSSAALSPDVDSFSAALSSGPVGPPERLSEKRRREEDDDDVLDKLVHHKRRNSSTSATSTSSNLSAAALRKKKGLGSRDSSPNGAGPKRISINISSSVKNAATALAVNAPGSGGEEEA